MATFNDKEHYIVVAADKALRRKTNALGVGGNVYSEQFPREQYISLDHVYNTVPTSSTNFASPNYVDYTTPTALGGVGTRFVQVRLHPVIISGLNGPQTIQSFLAVSAPPTDDSTTAVDAVRIKQIIPSDFSPQRTNAADANVATRGFELALYPAIASGLVGSPLVADTSNGPIPITADPSAVNGIGDGYSWWYVDYDAGAVLFTEAPLNGSTGVMNPNNVYGDINGNLVDPIATPNTARLTMFATFYQYTGTRQGNIETYYYIGDGINSFGNFNGTTDLVFDTALTAAGTAGGIIVVKPGTYTFANTVSPQSNVTIIGDGAPVIIKPTAAPAFTIGNVNNVKLQGMTIRSTGSTSSPCINIAPTTNGQILQNIYITDNNIYANSTGTNVIGVGINNSATTLMELLNFHIDRNYFTAESGSSNLKYVNVFASAPSNNLEFSELFISNNIFDTAFTGSVSLANTNTIISSMDQVTANGNIGTTITFLFQVTALTNIYVKDNSLLTLTITGTSGSNAVVSGNKISTLSGLTISSAITSKYLNGNVVNGTLSVGVNVASTINTLDLNGSAAIGTYAGVNTSPTNGLIVSGNTGLGTSTVLNKLDVGGAVAIGSYAGVNTSTTNGLIVSGNVGVGTSTQTNSKLEVSGGTLTTTQITNGFEVLRESWNDPAGAGDAIRHFVLKNSATAGTLPTSTNYFIQRQTGGTTNLGYIGFLNSTGFGIAQGVAIGYGTVPSDTTSTHPNVGLYVDSSSQQVGVGTSVISGNYMMSVGPNSTMSGIVISSGTAGTNTGLNSIGGGITVDFSATTNSPAGLTIIATNSGSNAVVALNAPAASGGAYVNYIQNGTLNYRLGSFYAAGTKPNVFQLIDNNNPGFVPWTYNPNTEAHTFNNNFSISGDLTVDGITTLMGAVNINSNLVVSGGITGNGGLSIPGSGSITTLASNTITAGTINYTLLTGTTAVAATSTATTYFSGPNVPWLVAFIDTDAGNPGGTASVRYKQGPGSGSFTAATWSNTNPLGNQGNVLHLQFTGLPNGIYSVIMIQGAGYTGDSGETDTAPGTTYLSKVYIDSSTDVYVALNDIDGSINSNFVKQPIMLAIYG